MINRTLAAAAVSAVLLVPLPVPLPAHAQVIADPAAAAAQRPAILSTANDLPQVDITAPTAAGVSVNRFVQFDVDAKGAIVNNGRTASSTSLAGWVAANPALLAKPARVIVGEVRSRLPSQLNGFIEIAGTRADLILANPAGISCDGCGFLNAQRAELATGTPQWLGGQPNGFAAGTGALKISGAGLDARAAESLSLFTQAAQINAGLWAKRAQLTLAAPPGGAPAAEPSFALDVAAIGGMYANSIRLIGTAHGLGARNLGTVAAGESLVVDVDGRLVNSGTLDARHVAISATDVDNLAGARILGQQVAIATGRLANAGHPDAAPVIAAAERLDLGVRVLENTDAALVFSAGDLAIGGALDAQGRAIGKAEQVRNHAATIEALGDMSVSTRTLYNSNGGVTTEERPLGPVTDRAYLRPDGHTQRYPLALFRYEDWSRAGQYRWQTDPARIDEGVLGRTPMPAVSSEDCDESGNHCISTPGGEYPASDPAWAYFGLTPPDAPPPTPGAPPSAPTLAEPQPPATGTDPDGSLQQAYQRAREQYDAAWTDYRAQQALHAQAMSAHDLWQSATDERYAALDNAIATYNAGFSGGAIRAWTRYDVKRQEHQSVVTASAPARLVAGRDLTLVGDDLVNDQSQMLAGGTLAGTLDKLTHIDALGTHRVHETGTSQHSKSRWRGGLKRYHQRDYGPVLPFVPADELTTIVLPVTVTKQQASADQRGAPALDVAMQRVTGDGNALWQVNPAPGAGPLFVTDPRFTRYRDWISSERMLSQLQADPATRQQQIGDGFIEQRLVREQIAQLTGRRWLPGHADDEAQYAALLAEGLAYAKAMQLRPGIALSAEQVGRLTSDLVWLVERELTLADGSRRRVLVPQVYLRPRPGDLAGDGSLIAAQTIDLLVRDTVANAGTIAAHGVLTIDAGRIEHSGTLAGETVTARTDTDLLIHGGAVKARDGASLSAGRDLVVESSTRTGTREIATREGRGNAHRTGIDRVAHVHVSGTGALQLAAGRDIVMKAAAITHAGDGPAVVSAGRELRLDALTTETSVAASGHDARNFLRARSTNDVGSKIAAHGEITLAAGRDAQLKAATVRSDAGPLTLDAGRDLSIAAGEQTHALAQGNYYKHRSALGSKSTTTRSEVANSDVVGSELGAAVVTINAGRDARIDGSSVVADSGARVTARRDLQVGTATARSSTSDYRHDTRSGLMSSGGLGVTIGRQRQTSDSRTTRTTAVGSTVGSLTGDVTLAAGSTLTQTGSAVLAPEGDLVISAPSVTIDAAYNSETSTHTHAFRQSGVTVAISNPVVAAVQTAQQMQQAAARTSDPRMQALAAANTVLAAAQAADAVRAGQGTTLNDRPNQIATGDKTSRDATTADKIGGVQMSISVGSSRSDSQVRTTREQAVGATVAAGGDVTIAATGAPGAAGTLDVRGSTISAGQRVTLIATDTLTLDAAADTEQQRSRSSNASASIGVTLDSRQSGVGVTIAGSRGRGRADGESLSWRETTVTAGQQARLASGADMTLDGAIVTAPQVTANVGGDLKISSRQDTETYLSRERQTGGSVTLSAAPSANLQGGRSDVDSVYASVNEVSGLKAGDAGVDIAVAGNATLTGAVIASTQTAVDADRNRVTVAGNITTRDIVNEARFKADAVSVNLGTGYSASGAWVPSGTGVGLGSDGDQATSITRAGISGIAGDTTVRSSDSPAPLAKVFDAQRVQNEIGAQAQITQTFSTLAPRAVAAYADRQLEVINAQLQHETDDMRRAELLAEKQRWTEGGIYRVVMHTATGTLTGDVAGGAGAGVAAMAAPALNDWQATMVNALTDVGMNSTIAQGVVGQVTGLVAAGIGAVAGGSTGAGSALAVDVNNRQLHPDETQWIRQHAKRFAQQQNISEAEAERRLAQQAFRQVQFGTLGDEDVLARQFLGQAKGLLTADPDCPSCGPGYMFYATPHQKAALDMYADQSISDPKILEFYARNGISQPTSQQIQASANRDARVRDIIGNATQGAAGVAAAITAPPAVSWCLANPVACNRVVLAGGEIAAGDALGPAGLGVIGTASVVKAVRSAEEVNAVMRARGWEPAWSPGTPVIETTLEVGTRVNMIVNENTAEAIRRGHFSDVVPGGWATFDKLESIAVDMRQQAAISNKFKPQSDGPFFLVELEITQPLKSNIGFVGAQTDAAGGFLRGGGTQIQFDESVLGKDRLNFLKPVSKPRLLK